MKNQNNVPIGGNYTNRKDCNKLSGNSGRNPEIINNTLDGVESSPDSFSQLVPGSSTTPDFLLASWDGSMPLLELLTVFRSVKQIR